MSYTNETTFYGLPLPTGSDKSTFTDNNTAFQAVDAALHTAYEQSGAATEDIVAIKATVANLIQADVNFQNDLDTEKGKIVNLQDKEVLQDAAIAAVKADAQDMITAYNEPTATSTHAYDVGDYFIYNDVLYRAIDSIAIGDTIVPDTNCTTTNITTEVLGMKSTLMPKTGLGSDYYHTPTSTWTIAANDEQTVDEFSINVGDSGNYLVNFIAEWQADCKYILRINNNIVSVVSSGVLSEVLHLTGGDLIAIRVQNNSSDIYTVSNDSTKFRLEAFKLSN